MKTKRARKGTGAFYVASVGRVRVPVYARKTPNGTVGFMVADFSGEKRRFRSYPTAADAQAAALRLARLLSTRQTAAATISNPEALDYAAAREVLAPYGDRLAPLAAGLGEALKLAGDVPRLIEAARHYASRAGTLTPKPVAEAVEELLKLKESRGASVRYVGDLRARLRRFAGAFKCDMRSVTAAQVQAWIDGLGLSAQSATNYRRCLSVLFAHGLSRAYCAENPVERVERIKVRNREEVEIYTPAEFARLLGAAPAELLPVLVLGGLCGLRTQEILRLTWEDIDVAERHVVVSAQTAKTAARRVVPLCDAAMAWLADYSGRTGLIWPHPQITLYKAIEACAAATGGPAGRPKPVRWLHNGLRHSWCSYRLAVLGDAGRVAGEAGNSAAVVHKHYKAVTSAKAGAAWFSVSPVRPHNVATLPAVAVS